MNNQNELFKIILEKHIARVRHNQQTYLDSYGSDFRKWKAKDIEQYKEWQAIERYLADVIFSYEIALAVANEAVERSASND